LYDAARELDRNDPLAEFAARFEPLEPGLIYLDGNSLGRMPRRAAEDVMIAAKHGWGQRLIRGWNDGWIDMPSRLGAKVAAIVGAEPDEVILADSTSTNLFKLASAVLRDLTPRRRIVSDSTNFPSDLYILQGLGELVLRDDLAADDETALVSFSHVAFKSGAIRSFESVNAVAGDAYVLADISHSVGVVSMDIHQVPLAVGCCYKHLHGGPGALAFLYVRKDVQDRLHNPIQGWLGREDPFSFELDYRPKPGIERWQVSTPSVLSMVAMEAGLDLVLEAGMVHIRQKSSRLTEFFISLVDAYLPEFQLATPRESELRGSHVLLRHPEAWRITRALVEQANVIPDFRAPDGVRFGFAPLYNSFEDVAEAVRRLKTIMETKSYEQVPAEMPTVT
jgi:kynureninase